MRTLLIVTALLEAVVGFVLAAAPSVLASILFGAPLDTPSGSAVGRLAGIALLTMGLFLAGAEQPAGLRVSCASRGHALL
jgi:hypothetical protein